MSNNNLTSTPNNNNYSFTTFDLLNSANNPNNTNNSNLNTNTTNKHRPNRSSILCRNFINSHKSKPHSDIYTKYTTKDLTFYDDFPNINFKISEHEYYRR